jgi:cytochrome c biogenesis protein CcmG, thiol:disulfide interchange protein DsbE
VRRVAFVGCAVLLAATSGCAGHHHSAAQEPSTGATHALIAAADLARCPTSATTPVSGGLPNVTLSCLANGPAVRLAGLTGTPTVVNIWGSWCGPCQAEETYLSSAYDKTRDKVRFLGVDTEDEADSALSFDAHVKPPVHFPSVFDPDKKVLLDLHFVGPPETLYVDAAGRIVYINRVPYTSTSEVTADISKYLHVT